MNQALMVVIEMVLPKDHSGETAVAGRYHPPVNVNSQLQLPAWMTAATFLQKTYYYS